MRRSQRILEKLIKLETLLIVQDPKGPLSADAYDGLRKSVVHATQAQGTTSRTSLASGTVLTARLPRSSFPIGSTNF